MVITKTKIMKDIAIYGAGGWGREVACLIKRINEINGPTWNFIGFFDDGLIKDSYNEYGKILGNFSDLEAWNTNICIAFAIGNPQIISNIYAKITNKYIEYPNLISPDVLVYDYNNFKIGRGNIISARCLVSCNVIIGNFNSINVDTRIGHDVRISDFNAIMSAVNISGGVNIGNLNFIGANTTIIQYKNIGDNTTIGAGSVILLDTESNSSYFGNPARKFMKK